MDESISSSELVALPGDVGQSEWNNYRINNDRPIKCSN